VRWKKFLAPGRGRDFCQLSVSERPKKEIKALESQYWFTKNEIKITFCVFTIDHATKILVFKI